MVFQSAVVPASENATSRDDVAALDGNTPARTPGKRKSTQSYVSRVSFSSDACRVLTAYSFLDEAWSMECIMLLTVHALLICFMNSNLVTRPGNPRRFRQWIQKYVNNEELGFDPARRLQDVTFALQVRTDYLV